MVTILIALTTTALAFHAIRFVVRGPYRRFKPVKVNECSQELLDFWGKVHRRGSRSYSPQGTDSLAGVA
jgi:hypothetical protein